MNNKLYNYNNYVFNPADGGYRFKNKTNVSIDSLGLNIKQKFLFHYDFGDDWVFVINVQDIEETDSIEEPYLLKEKGNVLQYSGYDEFS